jgi:hypothetical protein
MTKLNARDRAQLVVIAYESGLVTPGRRGRHDGVTHGARVGRLPGQAATRAGSGRR